MTNEILKLDQKAVDKLNNEIKQLTKEIATLSTSRGEAFNGGLVDNWLKPSEVKVIDTDIRCKQQRLNKLMSIRYVLIEESHEAGIVGINSNYKLLLKYSNGRENETIIKLVTSEPEATAIEGYPQISTRSPLGKAIFEKKIGETSSFKTPMGICNVTILEEIVEESTTSEQ